MRAVSAGYAALLDGGGAGIWRHLITITPRAGSAVYWTDNETDLVYDGHTFLAGGTGTTVPVIEWGKRSEKVGTEITKLDLRLLCGDAAAFQGVRLPLAATRRMFDGAVVQVERVIGAAALDLTLGTMPLFYGIVAEARPSSTAVELDIDCGLAALTAEIPRKLFKAGCTNILFDAQCGLVKGTYTVTATVGSGASVTSVPTNRTEATGYFDLGVLTFAAGTTTVALRGVSRAVRTYSNTSGTFTPDRPLPAAPVSGDTFTVYPGCPKTLTACETKFAADNRARFRGFPFVPRTDDSPGLGASIRDTIADAISPTVEYQPERSEPYGTPVPVVYGKNRIPGRTLYREAVVPTTSIYDAVAGPCLAALCEGPITAVDRVFYANTAVAFPADATQTALLGTRPTQTAWSELPTGKDLGYPGVALVGYDRLLGDDSADPEWEVRGLLAGTGGSDGDADPAQVIPDLLTDTDYGAGFPFTITVDEGLNELAAAASSYARYVSQAEMWISPAFTTRKQALDALDDDLCFPTNATPLWRANGELKIVPLADTAVGTFAPMTGVRYALTRAHLLAEGDEDPIAVEIAPETDTYNVCPVTYRERAPEGAATDGTLAYTDATEEDPDPVDISLRGERPAAAVSVPAICLRSVALRLSRILAQRQVRARLTVEFRVPGNFALLEPCDLVTVTDEVFPFTSQPFQILEIEEEMETGVLTVRAQEWEAGVNHATEHATQTRDGAMTQWTPYNPAPWMLTGQAGELWPNGASEIMPPPGADLTSPAFTNRYEAGAGAWAGTWVRRIVASGASANLIYGPMVPAVPGHSYTIDARVKVVSGDGTARLYLVGFTAAGTVVSASWVDTTSTSWVACTTTYLVPAAAQLIQPMLRVVNSPDCTADFDAVSFYRSSTETPTLTAGVSPSTVSGECTRGTPGTCTATTDAATVAAAGGVPVYTYAWEYVSGTTATVNSPTSATTTFSRTATGGPTGVEYNGVYRCKVTDHEGTIVYTSNVTVTTTHTAPIGG